MTVDRAVLLLAGTVILTSVVLVLTVSPWWLVLTSLVGLNLAQSSLTGICTAASILARAGLPGESC